MPVLKLGRVTRDRPNEIVYLGELQAHPERLKMLRNWHLDQAVHQNPAVSTLNVSITLDGSIRTSAVAIEPEHAGLIADHLEQAARQLRASLNAPI